MQSNTNLYIYIKGMTSNLEFKSSDVINVSVYENIISIK